MNKFVVKSAKFTGTGLTLGALFTAYHYPQLREEPAQLILAMRRGMRCVTTGASMAGDYLKAGDAISSDTHSQAADRLFKMFCANGGPYIKLGQMFG